MGLKRKGGRREGEGGGGRGEGEGERGEGGERGGG